MDEFFIFITLMLTSYLLLGGLFVAVFSFLIRFLNLNASTKHNIWLTVLFALIAFPLVIFLPSSTDSLQMDATPDLFPTVGRTTLDLQLNDTTIGHEQVAVRSTISVRQSPAIFSNSINLASSMIGKLPLAGLGLLFSMLIIFGIGIKLVTFIRSYRSLRIWFRQTQPVDDRLVETLRCLQAEMGIQTNVRLVHSSVVKTPSTSGYLRPWIVLPSNMLTDKPPSKNLEQLLRHELAHVKRCDTLAASFQAFVSIFLFWHPAINYTNNQIRFQRELACDDWVIAFSLREQSSSVREYANSLLEIANSVQNKGVLAHSVACVHSSLGLMSRVSILLDNNVDHTVAVKTKSSALMSLLAIASIVVANPVLPKLPVLTKQALDVDSLAATHTDNAAIDTTVLSVVDLPLKDDAVEPQDEQIVGIDLLAFSEEIAAVDERVGFPALPAQSETSIPASSPSNEEGDIRLQQPAAVEIISVSESSPAKKFETEPVSGPQEESSVVAPPMTVEVIIDEVDEVVEALEIEVLAVDQGVNGIGRDAASTGNRDGEQVVIDDLSRSELRAEISKIQDEFIRVFNAVVEDDRYKIHCENYLPVGTHIPQYLCEPNFVRNARTENAIDWRDDIGILLTPMSLRSDLSIEYEQLADTMLKEMKDYRYLRELYQVLAMLSSRTDELAGGA